MSAARPPRISLTAGADELYPALHPWFDRVDRAGVDASGSPFTDCARLVIATPTEAPSLLSSPPAGPFNLVLWPAQQLGPDDPLLRHPRVAGVLDARPSPASVYSVLRTALTLLDRQAGPTAAAMLEHVLEIGRALASEKDLDTLLGLILSHARALTGADGSSIYTRDPDDELYFRLWQNASNAARANAQKALVGDDSIAGYVARSGEVVAVDDVYAMSPSAPYKFNPASDHAIGYRTRSLLTLPLTNKNAEVVGVLQLVNRKSRADVLLRTAEDVARHVIPFDPASRQLAQALAGQAGVALENSMLYADIERLFEGFITASVQAIEARDPTTAGHSFRVAAITENLALAVDRSSEHGLCDVRFTREQLREIRYAALLHDFGKLGVRESVLVKAKKLHPEQLALLKQRFRQARLGTAWARQRQLMERAEHAEIGPAAWRQLRAVLDRDVASEHARLDRFLQIVLRLNEPSILHDDLSAELHGLLAYTYPDMDGDLPLLEQFEFAGLALSKGSLSEAERREIEAHVTHTYEFLRLIPWTRDLARLPDIAYAHHEKLDGTGYPRGLRRDEIPLPARMMTIADIYDALTAPDRPYKPAVGQDRALDILQMEARAGKLDGPLLQVFIDAGAYRIGQ